MSADTATVGPGTASADGPRTSRRWAPIVLIVLATVLAVVSATTTWVRTQALDTDEWVDASAEVLESDVVKEALATYLVDELYANVDLTQELESLLPDQFSGLAAPLAGALRGPAGDAVERVLSSPAVQRIWEEANRIAHGTFVAIVRDETRENISTANGEVVLDLGAAVRAVGEQLGVPSAALDRIPEDVGQITVFESSELADVQDVVRVLDFLSWFLFLVVVVLYALAVYLAGDRRRETLRNVGLSIALGSAVLWVLRAVAVRTTLDLLVQDPANRPVAEVVADVATQLVRQMAWTGFVLGLVIALYAVFIGPHEWARAVRRRLAGTTNPNLIITAATAVVLIVLLWWSPGRIFERWVTALTMIGLVIGAGIGVAIAVRDEQAQALEREPADADGDPDGSGVDEAEATVSPS